MGMIGGLFIATTILGVLTKYVLSNYDNADVNDND